MEALYAEWDGRELIWQLHSVQQYGFSYVYFLPTVGMGMHKYEVRQYRGKTEFVICGSLFHEKPISGPFDTIEDALTALVFLEAV